MNHVLAIAGREIRSLFSTPVAYVLFAVYSVFAGFIFFLYLEYFLAQQLQIQAARIPPDQLAGVLAQYNLNDLVIGPAIGTFPIAFVLLIPLLTMRALAEERAFGTIELLLTSPLSSWEIVLGKYLGVLALVGMLVGLTALYPALLFAYGNPELLQTAGALLGLLLYGAALAALGCFVSSLTRSQIIAAVVSFFAGLILVVIDAVGSLPGVSATTGDVFRYLGMRAHMDTALEGVIATVDLVYFAIMIAFFLALTRTSVESLRWR